jgi:hypothetical protein
MTIVATSTDNIALAQAMGLPTECLLEVVLTLKPCEPPTVVATYHLRDPAALCDALNATKPAVHMRATPNKD